MTSNRFNETRIEQLSCPAGKPRAIRIWEPENTSRVLLAIHGGMSHAGDFMVLAESMSARGYATVAYDQYGHDRKHLAHIPRFEVFLEDLERMLEGVKNMYPGLPVFILSHSMGALVSAHLGLKRFVGDEAVKGFISSSPYWVNAIHTPWIVRKAAGLLSVLAPQMKVPIEDIRDYVTHDREIMDRQREDIADDYMASGASARFAAELLKAQAWLGKHIGQWEHPLLAIVAGDDKLADSAATRDLLGQIAPELLTELYYPDNFHENFNETNREEIFEKMDRWMDNQLN